MPSHPDRTSCIDQSSRLNVNLIVKVTLLCFGPVLQEVCRIFLSPKCIGHLDGLKYFVRGLVMTHEVDIVSKFVRLK